MIPEEVIEEIRGRLDVVAVIGRHVELKRSGRTWKGCCPFHGERTPSFHVYPEDKHFKCYGCGEYGDVFKFLQKLQGKEFPEVVRELAAEAGVTIPDVVEESAEARERRRDRNEIYAACDAAARYWAARLASRFGEAARRYLAGRGVSDEMAVAFRLGVAAPEWSDLAGRLKQKGIGVAAVRKAGLLVEGRERGDYDRFRGRLMFPISGIDGQVIGFGGRALGEEKGAKYINTPETLLYKKSRVLYGIDLAREAIRKTRSAVLVEGYFDVIGLHQAGVKNAVAVCGTALTPEHVELLKRCDCRDVVVLFDGDQAGLAAPAKAAQALLPAGIAGRVAVLPSAQGKIDPDDYARAHGRAGVEALLAAATPLSEFLIERAVERACGPRGREAALEAKLAAVRDLAPFVKLAPEGLARTTFEDAIARRLDLDVDALRAEISGERPRRREPQAAPPPVERRPGPRVTVLLPGPAADALGLLAAFPDLAGAAAEEGLPHLMAAEPLAAIAADLIRSHPGTEAALERLAEAAGEATVRRLRDLCGPLRPRTVQEAERELRRAAIKAAIAKVVAEQGEVARQAALGGSPVPEELRTRGETAFRRRADLEKRLRSLEKGP
ncbi:MAG TPA: DNA primase [Anaeromyxobacteraceae bacterium]|nr:DNA primase [Anaeromyxobacteraceae bacterium]